MRWRLQLVAICGSQLLVWGVAGQEAPATKEPNEITAETLLKMRDISDPQFSPDGTKVAFVVAEPRTSEHRKQHIWIYDEASNTARQITYSEKSEHWPRWSPDGKSLAFLSNREGDDQRIYVLRMAAGEGVALTKPKVNASALEWSPDGKAIAYLAEDPKTEAEEKKEKEKQDEKVVEKEDHQPRLRLIQVATREEKTLTPATWKVEEVKWMPDGQRLVVKATEQPWSDRLTDKLYLVTVAGGAVTTLYAPAGPFEGLRIAQIGEAISFIGSRDAGPIPHDVLVVSAHGSAPKNLTGASLDRAVLDHEWAGSPVVVLYEEGFRTRFTTFAGDGERKDQPEAPVTTGEFALSKNGELAYAGQSWTKMPELWIRDAKGEDRQVTHVNEWAKDLPLRAAETYKYKSFDGMEMEGAVLKPANYDGKSKLPMITLVHGGPTGAWHDGIEPWGQLLAAKGFVVFYPNPRGSTGYGEKFLELNRADWGGGDFKDIEAGIDDLIAKGIADPDRLGIGGWSYGGYMAEWAVTQTQRFKAAVAGAGMSNLISEYGTESGPEYDEWFWGVPYEKPEGFLNSSPFLFVKNARTPTLILQGEKDPIDPIGQSQELYRGLKRYGVETELVVYPREPHGLQEGPHRANMETRMVEWFEKHVKNPKPAPAPAPAGEKTSSPAR